MDSSPNRLIVSQPSGDIRSRIVFRTGTFRCRHGTGIPGNRICPGRETNRVIVVGFQKSGYSVWTSRQPLRSTQEEGIPRGTGTSGEPEC